MTEPLNVLLFSAFTGHIPKLRLSLSASRGRKHTHPLPWQENAVFTLRNDVFRPGASRKKVLFLQQAHDDGGLRHGLDDAAAVQ